MEQVTAGSPPGNARSLASLLWTAGNVAGLRTRSRRRVASADQLLGLILLQVPALTRERQHIQDRNEH